MKCAWTGMRRVTTSLEWNQWEKFIQTNKKCIFDEGMIGKIYSTRVTSLFQFFCMKWKLSIASLIFVECFVQAGGHSWLNLCILRNNNTNQQRSNAATSNSFIRKIFTLFFFLHKTQYICLNELIVFFIIIIQL